MIANKHLNKIQNIEPIDDRLMTITLREAGHTTFINTYMYSAADHEQNEERYGQLRQAINNSPRGGQFTQEGT